VPARQPRGAAGARRERGEAEGGGVGSALDAEGALGGELLVCATPPTTHHHPTSL
jgi:hypothetical protein